MQFEIKHPNKNTAVLHNDTPYYPDPYLTVNFVLLVNCIGIDYGWMVYEYNSTMTQWGGQSKEGLAS